MEEEGRNIGHAHTYASPDFKTFCPSLGCTTPPDSLQTPARRTAAVTVASVTRVRGLSLNKAVSSADARRGVLRPTREVRSEMETVDGERAHVTTPHWRYALCKNKQ